MKKIFIVTITFVSILFAIIPSLALAGTVSNLTTTNDIRHWVQVWSDGGKQGISSKFYLDGLANKTITKKTAVIYEFQFDNIDGLPSHYTFASYIKFKLLHTSGNTTTIRFGLDRDVNDGYIINYDDSSIAIESPIETLATSQQFMGEHTIKAVMENGTGQLFVTFYVDGVEKKKVSLSEIDQIVSVHVADSDTWVSTSTIQEDLQSDTIESKIRIHQILYGECNSSDCDLEKQLADSGSSSTTESCSIIVNPDFSFTIPSIVYNDPLIGSMNLNVSFDYFGEQGGVPLWVLDKDAIYPN